MDWQGQKLSEQLMQIMLVASALIAFAVGYVIGSFRLMLLIYLGGVILTTLITVPNWPIFNRHPLKWLESEEAERNPKPLQTVIPKKKTSKAHQK
ncbi:hypothetical protein MKW94_009766 [Papaver nudicaule]|uniref:Signal peptidase complex subunit 1 n=1 Tax=Papaver nudicaule TaxID=74823 RepID=A0AA41VNS7_PAPNU|nr:hypothetical protein [Papaver nudicaule]